MVFQTISEYFQLVKLQREMAAFFPTFSDQKKWLQRLKSIDTHVKSAHNPSHLLKFLIAILKTSRMPEGCIVEAGAYKGAGSCKISLFAQHVGKKVFIFDSFQGLPENTEAHEMSTEGHSIKGWFNTGNFAGSLEEVKNNITKYGEISVCEFVPGWFEETMPAFNEKIVLAYLDVDLASSTRTCMKYLYPLVIPGGAIFSQDGDFPLVIEVFKDQNFWKNEVGCISLPEIDGLGKKITVIRKV